MQSPGSPGGESSTYKHHSRRKFNHKKFEAKKRKIALRLKTEEELDNFRQETGGKTGGKWVNQKWVANKIPDRKGGAKEEPFDVKSWLKDTVLYFAFLFAFTFTIYAGRPTLQLVAYEGVWRQMIDDANIAQATTPTGVLDFLEDLMAREIPQGDSFTNDSYTFRAEYGSSFGSALVGPIRIRQMRIAGERCSRIHEKLQQQQVLRGTECYPAWWLGEEEKVYSKENGTVPAAIAAYNGTGEGMFSYKTAVEAHMSPIQGKFALYDGSGFLTDVLPGTAMEVIEDMRRLHWLDFKTRALVVEYMFYNADMDLFGDSRLLFEFLPSGAIERNVYTQVISLDRYPQDSVLAVLRIGALVLVYMTVMYYVLDDLDQCRQSGIKKYQVIGWAHMDLLNNGLFIVSGLFKLANVILVALSIPGEATDAEVRQKVRGVGDASYMEDQINGLNGFLLWVKLVKYVGVTSRINRLANTVTRSLWDVVTYLFLFGIISYAFAMLAFLMFGGKLQRYQTMTDSLITIFRAMYGDVDFLEVLDSAGPVGFVYLFLWLVVSVTVLLNMIIAILIEVYTEVRVEDEREGKRAVLDRAADAVRSKYEELFGLGTDPMMFDDENDPMNQERERIRKEKEGKAAARAPDQLERIIAQVKDWIKGFWRRLRGLDFDDEHEPEGNPSEADSDSDAGDEGAGTRKKVAEKAANSLWTPWPSRQIAPEPQPHESFPKSRYSPPQRPEETYSHYSASEADPDEHTAPDGIRRASNASSVPPPH